MEEVEKFLEENEEKREAIIPKYTSRKVEVFSKLHPVEYQRTFLNKGVRVDGRKLFENRNILITPNTVRNSYGSSLVKIGKTCVSCAIDIELAEPSIEKPKEGMITFEVKIPEIASPIYRKRYVKTEHTDLVFQFLMEHVTPIVNMEQLCLEEGKTVLNLVVSTSLIHFSGNFVDCALLAVVSALGDFRFPLFNIDKDEKKVRIVENRTEKRLDINHIPISQTFGIVDREFVISDPNSEEQSICQTVFSVVYRSDSKLISLWKPGGCILSDSNLLECLKFSKSRISSTLKLLKFESEEKQEEEEEMEGEG